MEINIKDFIISENLLEEKILKDPEFIAGVLWGSPRDGHPEGLVLYHIKAVLDNIDKYSDSNCRFLLRIVAILHDSFKCKAHEDNPDKKGHGFFAREFASKYTDDKKILNLLEFHDKGYFCWKFGYTNNNWDGARNRALDFIKKLKNLGILDLYMIFYKCDNRVEGKDKINYDWFEKIAKDSF